MDGTEVGVGNVGVDLSGGDVAMAQHGLDGSQISTVHQ